MDKSSKFRDLVRYRAGALCLVGILTATYMHSTTFMSQFFYGSLILGGVAALAIDAGVVAMSIFKDELIKDGELAWMVRIVTSLVLFASGIANMSEGFRSAYGLNLTWDSLMTLDPLTWTQWLAGTVVFPILAYVMCDTIGTRNLVQLRKQQMAKSAVVRGGKAQLPARAPAALQAQIRDLNKANARRQLNKSQRKQLALDIYKTNPEISHAEIADEVGVTPNTVRNYFKEMGVKTQSEKHMQHFSNN